ncbi:helix-turn-helix domain-containing protein [Streptomyces durocortorensis]|uniref:Helix-turn-helix transcriptional regulator n=1 Tax=Streptomyces durocortorensis TaxID=2811104 RepID=A0ABS2I9M6_9ACTN|nr:helix-turn-helix transcriptional regulator [Streptomyces durocortorensis]MBM7058550.1 helix-turn-helix transcriptional regulator [Streptomyces durocortorensis]
MTSSEKLHTAEQFTQALRQLVSNTGRSPEDIAKRAGLSGNTVRSVVSGKNWPRRNTVELVTQACGQNPKPWLDAWQPLDDAKPRPERGDDRLQEQIDALGAEVDRLSSQVRSLADAIKDGEEADRRRERRRADAFLIFLTRMPRPAFSRVEVDRASMETRAAPTVSYLEPAYDGYEVHSFLRKVKEHSSMEGLPDLAVYLATSHFSPAVTSVAAYKKNDDDALSDYVASDVDTYVAELQDCLHQYLRDCTDAQQRAAAQLNRI